MSGAFCCLLIQIAKRNRTTGEPVRAGGISPSDSSIKVLRDNASVVETDDSVSELGDARIV